MNVRFARPRDEVEIKPAIVVRVRIDVAEVDIRAPMKNDAHAFVDAVYPDLVVSCSGDGSDLQGP